MRRRRAGERRSKSLGGVDAAKRVRAGETFDVVALAGDVMAALEAEGRLLPKSGRAFVRSSMALAVRAGAPRPDLSDAESLRGAIAGAHAIAYSTGPSGTHFLNVAQGWGLDPKGETPRFIQARPGVPVASLIASGEAEIGVQQLSELLDAPGIEIVGCVPRRSSRSPSSRSGSVRHQRASKRPGR